MKRSTTRILSRILSMVFSLLILTTALPVSVITVSAAATEFAGGHGTEDDPYLIETKEHLNNMRNHLDANFKIMADIEFTDVDFAEGGMFYNEGQGWEPIGTNEMPFTGIFDGNGHIVSGLMIDSVDIYYIGLFGYNNGTIKNISLAEGQYTSVIDYGRNVSLYIGGISGYNFGSIIDCISNMTIISSCTSQGGDIYAGGICGYTVSAITGCRNDGKVESSATASDSGVYGGGIVGYSPGTIKDCENTGSITMTYTTRSAVKNGAGGIAGWATGSILRCTNAGEITAISSQDDAYAGGIAIGNGGTSTISHCYNTGNVSATGGSMGWALAGGILAENNGTVAECYNQGKIYSHGGDSTYAAGLTARNYGALENLFNTGTITAECTSYEPYIGGIAGHNGYSFGSNFPGKVTNTYNVGTVNVFTGDAYYGRITYSSRAGNIVGYNDEGIITNSYYVSSSLMGIGTNNITTASVVGYTPDEMRNRASYNGFMFDDVWIWESSCSLPILKNVPFVSEQTEENTTEFAGGNGLSYNPFVVSTKQQLNNVRNHLDSHFILSNPIVFSATDFSVGGDFYNDGAKWLPIGNEDTPFTGAFNGNGYTISGITVLLEETDGDSAYGGLFGCNAGYVMNLGVVGCDIISSSTDNYAFAGAVAGQNNGIIEHCYAGGNVLATEAGCYDGYAYAGGIAGFNRGKITTSYNAAVVTARATTGTNTAMAGGIAGGNHTYIVDCYNTGIIKAESLNKHYARAGGIAGLNNSNTDSIIENCYNIGSLICKSDPLYCQSGGIVGYNNGDVTNCYYMDVVDAGAGYNADHASIEALKCSDTLLKTKATYSGLDFEHTWSMETNSPYSYPQLRGLDALPISYEKGDVDQNGKVDAADALLALQATTDKVMLSAEQITLANVDGNIDITANDALLILQYATKKITTFPVVG